MKFRRVIIESRYAPSFPKPADHTSSLETPGVCSLCQWNAELKRNLTYARLAMRDCLLRAEAPYASHLLYTQEGVLDDTVPAERERGMLAGFAYRDAVAASVVYIDLGASKGMIAGIQDAIAKKRPVWFRSMPCWEQGKATSIALTSTEVIERLPELKDLVLSIPGTLS